MVGIDRSVKIFVRPSEYEEVKEVLSCNLLEFCEWYNLAKSKGARIIPNGMTGMIVIADNGYYYDVVIK